MCVLTDSALAVAVVQAKLVLTPAFEGAGPVHAQHRWVIPSVRRTRPVGELAGALVNV